MENITSHLDNNVILFSITCGESNHKQYEEFRLKLPKKNYIEINDKECTRHSIECNFDNVLNAMRNNKDISLVVLYLACNVIDCGRRSFLYYLETSNFDRTRPNSTSIPLQTIYSHLSYLPMTNKILILNCPYANAVLSSSMDNILVIKDMSLFVSF